MTRTSAFGRYGVRSAMNRWSGVSADGAIVAVSLWIDELEGPAGAMVYDKADTSDWTNGIAKREFFQHLQHALDCCRGIVRVIMVVRDPSNPSRTIDCYPAPNVVMRVAALNIVGLTFRLEQADPGILKSAA